MNVFEFCRYRAHEKDLLVLKSHGEHCGMIYIKSNDKFQVPKGYSYSKVVADYYGTLPILDHMGKTIDVSCRYLQIEY